MYSYQLTGGLFVSCYILLQLVVDGLGHPSSAGDSALRTRPVYK